MSLIFAEGIDIKALESSYRSFRSKRLCSCGTTADISSSGLGSGRLEAFRIAPEDLEVGPTGLKLRE
jgi:hypothetical protein